MHYASFCELSAVLPKPKNSFRAQAIAEEGGEDGDNDDEDDDFDQQMNAMSGSGSGRGSRSKAAPPKAITFKLLSRDSKGRFETRALQVPETNRMAVKLVKAEEAMRAERQLLKERVLQIEQLAAEAEVSADAVLPRNQCFQHFNNDCTLRLLPIVVDPNSCGCFRTSLSSTWRRRISSPATLGRGAIFKVLGLQH